MDGSSGLLVRQYKYSTSLDTYSPVVQYVTFNALVISIIHCSLD